MCRNIKLKKFMLLFLILKNVWYVKKNFNVIFNILAAIYIKKIKKKLSWSGKIKEFH